MRGSLIALNPSHRDECHPITVVFDPRQRRGTLGDRIAMCAQRLIHRQHSLIVAAEDHIVVERS